MIEYAIQAVSLFIVAYLSFKLVSERWEAQKFATELRWEEKKLAMESSARIAEQYWVRLEVLAHRLGKDLTATLRNSSILDKQQVFHYLLDFRLTLSRFYEDVSGIYIGEGKLEVQSHIDKIYQKLRQLTDPYEWSKCIHTFENNIDTINYLHETIDEMSKSDSVLAPLYQKFEMWLSIRDGQDCAEVGQAFKDYSSALNSMTRSTLSYLQQG